MKQTRRCCFAGSPEEICRLFQQFMREGDLDSLLKLYDSDAVFLKQSGEQTKGLSELRAVLAPLADAKTVFEFDIKQVIRAADIALMHTMWKVFSTEVTSQMRSRSPANRRTEVGVG